MLTEIDEDELEQARAYFDRGELADRAQFHHGDAIEIAAQYDGPFDIVHIDNEDTRYVEVLESIRGALHPGSLVIADNTIEAEPIDCDDLVSILQEEDTPDATEESVGIASYLEHMRSRDEFETCLIPLGNGIAVSCLT